MSVDHWYTPPPLVGPLPVGAHVTTTTYDGTTYHGTIIAHLEVHDEIRYRCTWNDGDESTEPRRNLTITAYPTPEDPS